MCTSVGRARLSERPVAHKVLLDLPAGGGWYIVCAGRTGGDGLVTGKPEAPSTTGVTCNTASSRVTTRLPSETDHVTGLQADTHLGKASTAVTENHSRSGHSKDLVLSMGLSCLPRPILLVHVKKLTLL